jgi:hypothetical protein
VLRFKRSAVAIPGSESDLRLSDFVQDLSIVAAIVAAWAESVFSAAEAASARIQRL